MKAIRIHPRVIREIEGLELPLRSRLTELLAMLADGQSLGMPVSRPMPIVDHGAHELRLKDRTGAFRVFYFTKSEGVILVFHFFKKKTQESPPQEIETAQRRLTEMRK